MFENLSVLAYNVSDEFADGTPIKKAPALCGGFFRRTTSWWRCRESNPVWQIDEFADGTTTHPHNQWRSEHSKQI